MTEEKSAPSWGASVLLDIGGHIGALILRTPAPMNGHEIDIINDDMRVTHSEVRARHLEGEILYAAVYPGLTEGMYTVSTSRQRIEIRGGHVADVTYDATEGAVDGAGAHDDHNSNGAVHGIRHGCDDDVTRRSAL